MKITCCVVFIVLSGYCKPFSPELIYLPKDSIKINENIRTIDLFLNNILEIGKDIWFEYKSLLDPKFNELEHLVPKKNPDSPPRIIRCLKN